MNKILNAFVVPLQKTFGVRDVVVRWISYIGKKVKVKLTQDSFE